MALTVIHEPSNRYINIFTDYFFEYHSSISDIINYKYKIDYQEQSGGLWSTIDTFARFPQPDTNIKFDFRRYLSTKRDSDYFLDNYNQSNGIYFDVLCKDFRLIVSDEYAYQFPWGIFDSSGNQLGTGVSAHSYKYYNAYDLKLTFTYPGSAQQPIFQVGSVVELIDNSNPLTNANTINGIYTVLEIGLDYIVVNGTYDSTITYYTGSVVWADKRQVVGTGTGHTYTSSTFTAVNSCKEDTGMLYTSLPSIGYNLRANSILLIPAIQYSAATITNNGSTVLNITQSATTNSLIRYQIPTTASTVGISIRGNSGTTDSRTFNIILKCDSKFKTVTLNFLDRNGAFIPFYFDLTNTKQLDVLNNNWKGLNSNNRAVKYQIDTQITERYQLTSDWLNDAENALFEELFASNYIYMFYEGSITPVKVLITDKSLQKKRTQTQKLYNYTLNVEVAIEKFTNQ